jgi:hypothetical protein
MPKERFQGNSEDFRDGDFEMLGKPPEQQDQAMLDALMDASTGSTDYYALLNISKEVSSND